MAGDSVVRHIRYGAGWPGKPLVLKSLVILAAGWTTWRLGAYWLLGYANIGSKVAAAACWLLLLGVLSVVLAPPPTDSSGPDGPRRVSTWWLVVFISAAFALYASALRVGFLSDDFILIEFASGWRLGPVHEGLFRPVPLFLWGLISEAGGSAVACHGINVLAHGANAFLVTRLAVRWLSTRHALLAGAIFLVQPTAVEAVVWCSGIFDVLATTFVLVLVLGIEYVPRAAEMPFALATYALALLSKETAVVAPLMGAIVTRVTLASIRRYLTWSALLVAGVTFGILRLPAAHGGYPGPLGRYALQRGIFSAIGTLANGWHVRVSAEHPILPFLSSAAVVLIFAGAAVAPARRRLAPLLPVMVCLVLLPLVPVLPFLVISDHLAFSRYVYTASAGWAIAMALLVMTARRGPRSGRLEHTRAWIVLVSSVIYVAGNVAATSGALTPWIQAGRARDAIINAAVRDPAVAACVNPSFSALIDSVEGVPVFRNGWNRPFARALLRPVREMPATDHVCDFIWDASAGGFRPASP